MAESGTDHSKLNPFISSGTTLSFAFCIWEVLKDRPAGLSIQNIADAVQHQNLRDLSGLKNAPGQVRWRHQRVANSLACMLQQGC